MQSVFSRLVVLTVFVLFGAGSARGQSSSPQAQTPARPRIGLALGGGSARGIAHVGVLEWFEEHHIPIDFIVGTSMGGLVAGAYASGMTPAEIRELMKTADWDLMFLSDSPYKYKTFRRKQDKRDFPSQLEFGLKHGVSLPGALNPGQQVALMLDRIALPYGDLQSFDDLPTPYRAVATDLRKGEVIVLGRPPLARAMRATMSIPGVFAPVNWDDWLLVDGGVLNNVPANVARELGVDIVIAVDVGADAGDEEAQTASLFALLGKTIDTMMTTTTRRTLAAANLIIDPDLKGLSSTSWRQADELADRGYKAAAAMESKLEAYAIGAEAHAAFLAARQAKRRRGAAVPTELTFQPLGTPVSPRVEAEIRKALSPLLNKPVQPDEIARHILEVTGSDRFRVPDLRGHRPSQADFTPDWRAPEDLWPAVSDDRAGPQQHRFDELRRQPGRPRAPLRPAGRGVGDETELRAGHHAAVGGRGRQAHRDDADVCGTAGLLRPARPEPVSG